MPLEQALGVGEAPVLLGMRRRRQEEHLGLDVLRTRLADSCSGESFQNNVDSLGAKSRTTSQSSLASARRISFELAEPTAGFCPTQNIPRTPPSSAFSIIA
jgi:hypothetical protein